MEQTSVHAATFTRGFSGSPEAQRLERLLHKLPHGGSLRPLVEEALRTGTAPASSAGLLVEQIGSLSAFRSRDREVAAWLLGHAHLSDTERCETAERLESLIQERLLVRCGQGILTWLVRTVCTLTLLLYGAALLCGLSMAGILGGIELGTVSLGALPVFIVLAALIGVFTAPLSLPVSLSYDYLNRERLGPAIATLGRLRVPQSIGTVARAYCMAPVRRYAAAALRDLNGTLRESHYGRMPAATVPSLCKALAVAEPGDLPLLLSALGTIGDGRAVPVVARLAARGVRQAADVLPLLLERRDREASNSTLLRPANAAELREELLRPNGAYVAHTDELLRPLR